MGPPSPDITLAPEASTVSAPSSEPTGEKPSPKEIPAQRQKQEIQKVSSNILYRKVSELRQARESEHPLSESEGNLVILLDIADSKHIIATDEGTPLKFSIPDDASLSEGTTIEVVLKEIKGGTGNELRCIVDDQKGIRPPFEITLPAEEVLRAQFIAEEASILQNFQGNELEMIKLYGNLKKDSNAQLPEGVNDLIKKTAAEVGILTVDDLISLQQTFEANLPPDPEQQAQTKAFVEDLKKLQTEGNLLDFENVTGVLAKRGFSFENATDLVTIGTTRIKELEEIVEKNPDNKEADEQLKSAKAEVSLWKQVASALKEDGLLHQYFQQAERGEIDLVRAKDIIAKFRSGKFDELLSQLPGVEQMSDQEKKALHLQLKSKFQLAGLCLILALLGMPYKNIVGLER